MPPRRRNRPWLNRAEDAADTVHRRCKPVLPFVARLCLVSTFLEDGLRMWFQWAEQRDYVDRTWQLGHDLATLFIVVNLVGQLSGSILILVRRFVKAGCLILGLTQLLQACAYSYIHDIPVLLRSITLTGSLLLLFAEVHCEARSLFAGVPALEHNKRRSYMQLAGRILVIIMFVTMLHIELTLVQWLQNAAASVLMLCVIFGYKTKLSALVLVIWLFIINVCYNAFWLIPPAQPMHDLLKYDFFQTISVIGGLLMIVSLGPGEVSVDERKKNR